MNELLWPICVFLCVTMICVVLIVRIVRNIPIRIKFRWEISIGRTSGG